MNRSIESALRVVNVTASGLLAGSLGFGEKVLVPGWENERPREMTRVSSPNALHYFNAIGPVALGTAVTLAVGSSRGGALRRTLDTAAAVGLAGVLAATIMVTVPINKRLDSEAPADYPREEAQTMVKSWSRAHALRTTLGVGAFVCAVFSNLAAEAASRG